MEFVLPTLTLVRHSIQCPIKDLFQSCLVMALEYSNVLTTESTLESFAKAFKFMWTIFGISLIYNLNSGPSTEPWETPLVTVHQLEKELFWVTLWKWSERKPLSHNSNLPLSPLLVPYVFLFSILKAITTLSGKLLQLPVTCHVKTFEQIFDLVCTFQTATIYKCTYEPAYQ